MSRDLTTAFETALTADTVRPVLFWEGEFDSGTVRLWSGYGELTWNSETWQGAGTLAGITAIEETGDIKAAGVTFSLSGIPSDMLELALGEVRQGKPVKLWLGLLSLTDGSVIADPDQVFSGRMDVPTIDEGGETSTIAITAENRLVDLERARERRYTHEDQQIDFSGDKGFEYVNSLQDKEVLFGGTSSGGGSSGSTGGGVSRNSGKRLGGRSH